MRRPSLLVVLALLVATAGCSGVTSKSTDDATTNDSTVTDTPTTATEMISTVATTTTETTATETAAKATTGGEVAAEVLPGLTEDGDLDAAALSGAHGDELADESLTLDSARVERYANGTVRSERNQTIRTAANRTRYRVVANASDPNFFVGGENDGELWADGTHVFRASTANGTTNYSLLYDVQSSPADPRDYQHGDMTLSDRILVLFTAFENERVERMDGGNATHLDRYRVTASDLAHPEFVAPDETEVGNATLDAVIESDGPDSALVREYTLRYEITVAGDNVQITERIWFSNVGETTVERPEWYDGAANRTD